MNEREELAVLKKQQALMEAELNRMSAQLQRLEQALGAPATTPVPITPPPIPPVIREPAALARESAAAPAMPKPESKLSATARVAVPAEPATVPRPAPEPIKPVLEPARVTAAAASATAATLTEPAVSAVTPARSESLEMRLGTFWLVRIGVVMVLTALVFFGHLAYENYISRLGPGGKVFLLYLASGMLLGAGWWWQRRAAKESLKNYAQVLFAGGLAAVYFTTYAAHHIERLRIISSAAVDGVLLLLCAGFMVWIADRKKSEVLALFAVGLAYYTSIITRVGYFTLYSNLVLTLAGVLFLVRNRWALLTFGSLAASYAAYGFWRFFDGSNWHWASPAEGLWSGTYFLISYWIVFTAGVFLSRHERFAGESRAGFLTLNNGAFFTFFLLTMLQVNQGGFWKFALSYGGVLLVLSVLAGRTLRNEPLIANAYLTQGLLLVTVGFISKFAGLRLALILAAESVILLTLGQRRRNLVLLTGAYVAAGLAVGWGVDGLREAEPAGAWLGAGLGLLMMVNALIVNRASTAGDIPLLRPQPGYFVVLGLVAWLAATWDNVSHEHFPIVLAVEGLVLTFSIYLVRLRELALLSQGYVVLAQCVWLFNWFDTNYGAPWWQPGLLLAVSLVLSHWWQHQRVISARGEVSLCWQAVYALAIVGVVYFWLSQKVEPVHWLALTSLLAVGVTAYGVVTRAWLLAACAQVFVFVSSAQFVWQLWQSKPNRYFLLAPLAALSLLSWACVQWFRSRPAAKPDIRDPLLLLARGYRWVALVLSIWWVCEYIPAREEIWVLGLLGLALFIGSGWRRHREALLFSAAYTATALVLFWLGLVEAPLVYVPNLLVIIALLAQRQVARRLADRYPQQTELHAAVILAGGLSLWRFLSLWVEQLEQARGGSYLTASWSVLALVLFTTGIFLRERMYRWLGLGILACALGRVVLFDVWKLETLYRILSFLALGIVLLVLGFIYNKYQEKIREWL